jgi:hypothetical protein
VATLVVTVLVMSYPSGLTDEQWVLLEPVFNVPGKRGRKHAADLRSVVDASSRCSAPFGSDSERVVEVSGSRVSLARFRASDFDAVHAFAADPRVCE